jgi:putative tricarboxylic transport membrane protein
MASERLHATDWEHLGFLAALLAFIIWYLCDATLASPTFSNLILVAPVGMLAILCGVYIVVVEILGHRDAAGPSATASADSAPGASPARFRAGSVGTIMLLMAFFALFVAAMPYAGLDVATFAFIAATLWLLGERRPLFILSLAFGVAAAISIAALALLTFPIPMGVARAVWSTL